MSDPDQAGPAPAAEPPKANGAAGFPEETVSLQPKGATAVVNISRTQVAIMATHILYKLMSAGGGPMVLHKKELEADIAIDVKQLGDLYIISAMPMQPKSAIIRAPANLAEKLRESSAITR